MLQSGKCARCVNHFKIYVRSLAVDGTADKLQPVDVVLSYSAKQELFMLKLAADMRQAGALSNRSSQVHNDLIIMHGSSYS